jgi:hypothetical protein
MMDEEFLSFQRWPDSIGLQILPYIRNSLIHATTPHGFRGILKDGYIIPNQGQFPYSHTQTPNYFGGHNGWTCVFDFAQATNDDIIHTHEDWQLILIESGGLKFLLDIDHDAVAEHLVPNAVAQGQGDPKKSFIWFVEAWVKAPIPLSAVKSCLVTHYLSDEERLNVIPFDLSEAKKILDLK